MNKGEEHGNNFRSILYYMNGVKIISYVNDGQQEYNAAKQNR